MLLTCLPDHDTVQQIAANLRRFVACEAYGLARLFACCAHEPVSINGWQVTLDANLPYTLHASADVSFVSVPSLSPFRLLQLFRIEPALYIGLDRHPVSLPLEDPV